MPETPAEATEHIPRVVMPVFETEEPCGKVVVEKPETSGGAMSRHTTYLVRGVFGDSQEAFSSRKRYSDFEWLRKTLASHFPGVLVPKIPPKQSTGRFDETFIEDRRAGLEAFLQRCLRRKQLAMGSQLLRSFLQAQTEAALEETRKEYDKRPMRDLHQDYKVAFAKELADGSKKPADDNKLIKCKAFMDGQVTGLRELKDALQFTVQRQVKANAAVWSAQKKLAEVCSYESGVLANASCVDQPRVQLLASLRQQRGALEDASALHFDLLLAAAERELDDAEAMQEAFKSLDELHTNMGELRKKADALKLTKVQLEGGGSSSGSSLGGVGKWFGGGGTSLEATEASLKQTAEDADVSSQWYVDARTIACGQEMKSFLADSVQMHRWSKEQFSTKSLGTAERLAAVWGGTAPSESNMPRAGVSSEGGGYPGGLNWD